MKQLRLQLKFLGIHLWWKIITMWIAITSAYLHSVIFPIIKDAFNGKGWIGDICYWFCLITYPVLTIGLIIIVFFKIYRNLKEYQIQVKGV